MNEIDLTQAGIVLAAVLAALILLSFVSGRPRRRKGPVRQAAATRPDRDVLRAEFAIALRKAEDRAERLAEALRQARITIARLEIETGSRAHPEAPAVTPEPAVHAYGAPAAVDSSPSVLAPSDADVLRDRLTALAAEVAAVTAAIEGHGGPIDTLVAGTDGASDTLADRIRRLRERVPASAPPAP